MLKYSKCLQKSLKYIISKTLIKSSPNKHIYHILLFTQSANKINIYIRNPNPNLPSQPIHVL